MNNAAGLRRAVQGGRPRGQGEGGRRDQGARLLLPHRQGAQVLRRGQEARGRHHSTTSSPPTSSAAMRGAPSCRSPSSPTSRSSPSTTAAPSPTRPTRPSTGRILLLTYREYVTRWDEIAGVFAKAAVWQGALDKFAEAKAGKRGTAEVDDEFLAEIERWRELLARNLVLRNPALRGRDVNCAVQQIIDRIVFLRICEARDLETFEQLRALLNGGHTYERLQELFRRADLRYNSGLFHFEVEKDRAEAPDTLTPGLAIDDKVLKDIIEHLYYPRQPLRVLGAARRHPGPRLRAVPGQGDPPDAGPAGQDRGEAGGAQGGRRLLHAHLHRGLHRAADGRPAAGGQDARAGGRRVQAAGRWTRRAAPARSCSARTSSCSTGTWRSTCKDPERWLQGQAARRWSGRERRRLPADASRSASAS